MHDTPWTYPLLCISALLGGAINSIAGGGTLFTFGALLAFLGPVAANATSTVALLPGSLAGAWGYRRELAEVRPVLMRLWAPSLMGGTLGALAVTRFPERVFDGLVPWLLLLASILLLSQRRVAGWIGSHPHAAPTPRTLAAVILFQLLVGIYGGYFGAGIGILMLSSLSLMGVASVHQMNGLKTILAATINGVTAGIFVMEGIVVWKYAAAMALSAVVGGYLGARGARRLPQATVRVVVLAVGFGMAGYSFYRRFFA